MFDSDVSMHAPAETVRFGKCWHGLVETHAAKHPIYTQYLTKYNDVTLTTRAGKIMPFPLTKYYIGREAGQQLTARSGPMCVYQHPLAQMEIEDADGRDWSGYVIFDIRNNEFPTGLSGYRYGAYFAFTPDDNGQGLLVRYDSRFSVLSPLNVNQKTSSGERVWYGHIPSGSQTFHYSRDGRRVYGGRFPTPFEIMENMSYADWDDTYAPRVYGAALSGGFSEGGEFSLNAQKMTLPPVPADVIVREYRDIREYTSISVLAPQMGTCIDPAYAMVNVYKETGPTVDGMMSLLDAYSHNISKTYISAAVDDNGGLSYLSFTFEEETKATGGGSADGNGYVTVGSEQCGTREGDVKVLGTYTHKSTSYSSVSFDITKGILEWGGEVSEVVFRLDRTTSTGGSRTVIDDGIPAITSYSDSTESFSITLDGVVLMSESDMYPDSQLRMIGKPFRADVYALPVGSGFFTAQLRGNGPLRNGQKWAVVSAYVGDYQSNDCRALFVIIERGTLKVIDGEPHFDPENYSVKVHVGKTFARGVVDPYIHEQEFYEPLYLIRAYDPIDKKISAVYPYPIVYQ